MKITGDNLRFLRYCKKEKQNTIAKKLNISQQAVSKIENADFVAEDCCSKYLTALGFSMTEAITLLNYLPPPALNSIIYNSVFGN